MLQTHPDAAWELKFATYDPDTYRAVLEQIRPVDVVLDIGAGDLSFSSQMARIAQEVYAVEIAPKLLASAKGQKHLPENLIPVCADARTWDFPSGITVGVLLMRHCTHFQQYAEKLRATGAQRLITNARWRMDVEVVDLYSSHCIPYSKLEMGWYACWCGSTGFKPGSAELLTDELTTAVFEVFHCPNCVLRNPEGSHQTVDRRSTASQNWS